MVKYLVGRVSDPILGLATGFFAYYLWETDPRNASMRPPGRSLQEVASRCWNSKPPPRTLYVGPEPFGNKVNRTEARLV